MLLFRLSKIISALQESGAKCTGVERTDIQFISIDIERRRRRYAASSSYVKNMYLKCNRMSGLGEWNERADAAGTAKPVLRNQIFIYERGWTRVS